MTTIAKSEEEKKLIALCEGSLPSLGFRVVDIDFCRGSRSLIRIFLEKKGGAVSIEDCSSASRLLSPIFDSQSWLTGSYDLEVSSPGLDRRLREENDFKEVVGEKLKIQLAEPVNGRGQVSGRLSAVQNGEIVISMDGQIFSCPLVKIKKAVRVWEAAA